MHSAGRNELRELPACLTTESITPSGRRCDGGLYRRSSQGVAPGQRGRWDPPASVVRLVRGTGGTAGTGGDPAQTPQAFAGCACSWMSCRGDCPCTYSETMSTATIRCGSSSNPPSWSAQGA